MRALSRRDVRSFTTPLALALTALMGWATPSGASAQDDEDEERSSGPRSLDVNTAGHVSLIGGRTLEEGEILIDARLGFPSFSVGGTFSPSDRFDAGVRLHVTYGSPFMGRGKRQEPFLTSTGGTSGSGARAGALLEGPLRFGLLARTRHDVALEVAPFFWVGRGSMAGAPPPFEEDAGIAVGGRLEARSSWLWNDKMTLGYGLGGGIGYGGALDDDLNVFGDIVGVIGLESLFTRQGLFFVDIEAGYGFAPDDAFDGHAVFRFLIGGAYRPHRR